MITISTYWSMKLAELLLQVKQCTHLILCLLLVCFYYLTLALCFCSSGVSADIVTVCQRLLATRANLQ